jgi:hypothetical protein
MNSPRELRERLWTFSWLDRVLVFMILAGALPLLAVFVGLIATRGICAFVPCDSIPSRVGVSRTTSGNQVTLWSAGCPGSNVARARVLVVNGGVVGDGDDDVLWDLVAYQRSPSTRFVVGLGQTGFTQLVHLREPLDVERSYTAALEIGSQDTFESFTISHLTPGRIRFDGYDLTESEFAQAVVDRCSRHPPRPSTLRVVVGLVPFVLLAIGIPLWTYRRRKDGRYLIARKGASGRYPRDLAQVRDGPSGGDTPSAEMPPPPWPRDD